MANASPILHLFFFFFFVLFSAARWKGHFLSSKNNFDFTRRSISRTRREWAESERVRERKETDIDAFARLDAFSGHRQRHTFFSLFFFFFFSFLFNLPVDDYCDRSLKKSIRKSSRVPSRWEHLSRLELHKMIRLVEGEKEWRLESNNHLRQGLSLRNTFDLKAIIFSDSFNQFASTCRQTDMPFSFWYSSLAVVLPVWRSTHIWSNEERERESEKRESGYFD